MDTAPHSVSAVAVIDLSDGGRGATDDPHGLLSSHGVMVIGGEEHDPTSDGLLVDDHTEDDDEEDEEDEEDEDDRGGCGPDCTHDHGTPVHMIHILKGGGGGTGGGSGSHSPTPSSTASASTSSKRKRVVLSIHEKQQVLQRLEMGEQPVVISRDFGISRQQVSDIKKNKDRILAFCIDAKHLSSLRRKTLKATTEYHPGVEQELYRWLIRQRKLGRGVSPDTLSNKTTDLFMQYAADDAANVSFRSINVWLRHFKRAHGIRAMTEDELAKLPDKFTPAMDMAGASSQGNASATGGESSNNEGSAGEGSPTPSMLQEAAHAHAVAAAAADDVSSYMSSIVLPPPQHQQFLLQNHAPQQIDTLTANSFQMLMLSSASMPPATPASALQTSAAVAHFAAPPSSLESCAQLAQKMTLQLSAFERDMSTKLDTLDARVEKLCFNVLAHQPDHDHHHDHHHMSSTRFA